MTNLDGLGGKRSEERRVCRQRLTERIDACDSGCTGRPAQGPLVHVRPTRYVHRGSVAVRPLSDAGGHGALARSLHDRDQSAAVRAARSGEHQWDVREQQSGGPGPAGFGGRDRGGTERLPGRRSSWRKRCRRRRAVPNGQRPGTTTIAVGQIRCAGCGATGASESDDRRARERGDRREGRMVVRALPLRGRGAAAARPLLHHACASWAVVRWAWSTRPATT